jgi:hypothetical protein
MGQKIRSRMAMNTQITSLRVIEKVTKSTGKFPDIPYLIANITWQVPTDSFYFSRFLRDSKEVVEELAIDNPSSYGDTRGNPPKYTKVWTPHDPKWEYLEKFQTFWMKTWVSDCPVVRSVLDELKHFEQAGEFSSVYRFHKESTLHTHLSTLDSFTD